MISLPTTILILIAAVLVNSMSVLAQKKYKFFRRFNQKAFIIHSIIITPLWLLFIYCTARLASNTFESSMAITILGVFGLLFALITFSSALRELGTQALSNGIFFGKSKVTKASIYFFLSDPMYDSYVLAMISIGMLTHNANYFPVAASLWILLKFESFIEKPE